MVRIKGFFSKHGLSIVIGLLVLVVLYIGYDLLLATDEFQVDTPDNCGKFVNLIQHSINDQTECRIKCKQQCNTQDAVYSKSYFEAATVGCHDCQCYCKR